MINDPITTYELNYRWRDFWGEYLAHVIDEYRELQHSDCYVPRFFHAPENSENEIVGPSPGYGSSTLSIPPGSFICGFQKDVSQGSPSYLVQIYDQSLSRNLFSQPCPISFIQKIGAMTNLFPKPYPVTGSGIFEVTFYTRVTQDCDITLAVAVPKKAL